MSGLEQFPLVDGLEFSHPNTISPYLTGRLEYSYLKNADGTSCVLHANLQCNSTADWNFSRKCDENFLYCRNEAMVADTTCDCF